MRVRRIAFWTALFSAVPYLVLKVLWLGGADVGIRPGEQAEVMQEPRMVVGNLITIGLMLIGVMLALVLARNRHGRMPAWIVLFVAGGAAGLLAPIMLGLPIGIALQWVVAGELSGGVDGELEGWVYAVVYGGFAVMGAALSTLLVVYADERWGRLFRAAPRPPGSGWIRGLAVAGMAPFGIAMLSWAVTGPGAFGPNGMESLAQRSVLAATGVLVLAGLAVPFVTGMTERMPRAAWLIGWVGCCTAAVQGPSQLILAHDGDVSPAIAALTVVTTPAAAAFGLAVLQRRRQELASQDTS